MAVTRMAKSMFLLIIPLMTMARADPRRKVSITPRISFVHPRALEIERTANKTQTPAISAPIQGNILLPNVAITAPRTILVMDANNLCYSSQI